MSLRFVLSFFPIFLFFWLSWSLIIKLPYKTTGIKTFAIQFATTRQFKEKYGSNSMQQHEPLLNISSCEIKCVNTIIKNKALTHIQSVWTWSLALVQQLEELTKKLSLANRTKHKDLKLWKYMIRVQTWYTVIQSKGKTHNQLWSVWMWSLTMVQQLEDLTKKASLANCTKRKDFALWN